MSFSASVDFVLEWVLATVVGVYANLQDYLFYHFPSVLELVVYVSGLMYSIYLVPDFLLKLFNDKAFYVFLVELMRKFGTSFNKMCGQGDEATRVHGHCMSWLDSISEFFQALSNYFDNQNRWCDEASSDIVSILVLGFHLLIQVFIYRFAAPSILKYVGTQIGTVWSFRAPYCECCGSQHYLFMCDEGGRQLFQRARDYDVDLKAPSDPSELLNGRSLTTRHLEIPPFQATTTFQMGRARARIRTLSQAAEAQPAEVGDVYRDEVPPPHLIRDYGNQLRDNCIGSCGDGTQGDCFKGIRNTVETILKHPWPAERRVVGPTYNALDVALYKLVSAHGEQLGPYVEKTSDMHLVIARKRELDYVGVMGPQGPPRKRSKSHP